MRSPAAQSSKLLLCHECQQALAADIVQYGAAGPEWHDLLPSAGREGTPDSDAGQNLTSNQRNHLRVKSWTKVNIALQRLRLMLQLIDDTNLGV